MKKKFSIEASSPEFKEKVKVVQYMIKTLKKVKIEKKPFYMKGVFTDQERGLFFDIYIGKKTMGAGKGKVNECRINWNLEKHPEMKGRLNSLTEVNLRVYKVQMLKAANIKKLPL